MNLANSQPMMIILQLKIYMRTRTDQNTLEYKSTENVRMREHMEKFSSIPFLCEEENSKITRKKIRFS